MTSSPRKLLVTADDFGIGPETTRGILELARAGAVTSTVLLVNSPYAEDAVRLWKSTHSSLEVGWHPCLTMDRPILPAGHVPSLVSEDGRFFSLGKFLLRLKLGAIRLEDLHAELKAQYRRFVDLMGFVPLNVNGHHHIHIFNPVSRILMELMQHQFPRPYLRRVMEPWKTLWSVPGIRCKRWLLSSWGKKTARLQIQAGYPGAEWLIGITDPSCVESHDFFTRWLKSSPGNCIELMCHPGHDDVTLLGRDATPENGQRERRVHEWYRMIKPEFQQVVQSQGFHLVTASALLQSREQLKIAA